MTKGHFRFDDPKTFFYYLSLFYRRMNYILNERNRGGKYLKFYEILDLT